MRCVVTADRTQKAKSGANDAIDLTLSESEDEKPKPKTSAFFKPRNGSASATTTPKASSSKPKASASKAKIVSSSDSDDAVVKSKAPRKSAPKRVVDEDDDSDEDVKPAKKARATPQASASKQKAAVKKSPKRPKTESESEDDKPAPKKAKAANGAPKPKFVPKPKTGPAAPGSKEIPEGEPDCLSGLAFVFTGELDSLSREEASDLVKRYGGRTTGAPSKLTSYVVVGRDAGPKKLEKIKDLGLKTLDEDGLLELIASRGSGDVDEKTLKKREKEAKEIKKAAKELAKTTKPGDDNALWTVKYTPTALKDLCGNKGQIEKLQKWLQDWEKSRKSGFKKGGPNATGLSRAVLISGPPGIGKTSAAHLVATLEGYTVLELNASDVRSKKLLADAMNDTINNTDISGYFEGGSDEVGAPVLTKKTCLIMDEVDGMSAGDRGGIGALNQLIKKTKIPIIAIANDAKSQKMKPLQATTHSLPFSRPQAKMIRARILTIAHREGLKLPGEVVDQLVAGTQADIRQVINLLSTYKLSQDAMNFDQGKKLATESAKNMLQTPFTIIDQLLGPYAFGQTSRATLTDRLELYFNDFSIIPLFMQENYPKIKFSRAANLGGVDQQLKQLELLRRASESISDGDLVDRVIHGSQQQWSLLPVHGIFSTVRPAFYCYGMGSFGGQGGGQNSRAFPGWLGKYSMQNRLQRELTTVQIRMRLRVSGSRTEVRCHYLPALVPKLVSPLLDKAQAGIDETIEVMDDYFLTRAEFDTILELKVGDPSGEQLLKPVATATKSAFTREFNKRNHPMPFADNVSGVSKTAKKLAGAEVPDVEDVLVDDVEEADDDDDDNDDISKDKSIKMKKPKGAAAPRASTSKPKK